MGRRPTRRDVLGGRILRVLQQVVDDLAQLRRIALDLGQRSAQRRMDHRMLVHRGIVDAIQMQHL
ncbi:hypothetical protein D9M70_481280 [compost metagenome]